MLISGRRKKTPTNARTLAASSVARLSGRYPMKGEARKRRRKMKKFKQSISLWSSGHITTVGSNILLPHDAVVVERRTIEWEVSE